MVVTASSPSRPDTAPRRGDRLSAFGRQRKPAWVLVGVVLATGCALGVLLLVQGIDRRAALLVLSRPLVAGQQVAEADLGVVSVASDGALDALEASRREELVGLVALGDLPAGTLVNRGQFGERLALGADEAVVALVLGPGALPEPLPHVGAAVTVVATPDEAGPASPDAGLTPRTWPARVFALREVEPAAGQDRAWVLSLALGADVAPDVAAAAARDAVRIALVAQGGEL